MQQNDSQQLTMKDIADALGTSIATVSRALKDNPRISEEMRERVRKYALEHNFSPNTIAENLRQSKVRPAKVIGVIVPQYTHYFFSSILSGIDEIAYNNGYSLMVAQSGEKYEEEVKICKKFTDNKVCGIIVSQAKDTTHFDHFVQLQELGVPLVFCDRICTGVNASRVVVDDYQAAFKAVNYLVETGCRNIAFFGAPSNLEISKNRFNGYCDALLQNKLEVNPLFVRMICDNRADAEIATKEILQQEEIPDAFFTVNDDSAVGILTVAKKMGYKIPQDISICGFTNSNLASTCDPMLTTVEQRGVELGREAANIIIDKMEGRLPFNSVEKRVVKTRLVIRESTR